MVTLKLPWPVSTNKAWKPRGNRLRRNPKASAYRIAVKSIVVAAKIPGLPLQGPLEAFVTLYPPDRRRRDDDNFAGKVLFDALTHAGVWFDDSQKRKTVVEWGDVVKGGCVVVKIATFGEMAA
ncbi:crossover junction endodeoxyribonuclease RusA [Fundidesulfovibrio butyratiphilus]